MMPRIRHISATLALQRDCTTQIVTKCPQSPRVFLVKRRDAPYEKYRSPGDQKQIEPNPASRHSRSRRLYREPSAVQSSSHQIPQDDNVSQIEYIFHAHAPYGVTLQRE